MKCCVPGCTSANVIKGGIKFRQYSFFRFPLEPKQQKEWREILRVKEVPGVSQKVCEKHFAPKYLEETPGNKKRLDWKAIPRPMEERSITIPKLDKPRRKGAEARSEFYRALEEYKRAKEKYFNLLGIPKEFEDDFDDAEFFGIHYEGLPWWARPRLMLSKLDEDEEPEDVLQKKLCEICGKLEVNYDLHMLLFHPPEIKMDIDVEVADDQEPIEFEVFDQDGGESVGPPSVGDDQEPRPETPKQEPEPIKEKEAPKNKYMCSCYKIVTSIEALVDHISRSQSSNTSELHQHNLECINCQSQFRDLALFKRHVDADGTLCFKSAHLVAPIVPPLGRRMNRLRALRMGYNSKRTKECEVCGIMFPYGQAFMDHQRTVHGLDSADELVNYLMEPDLNELDDLYTKEIEDEETQRMKRQYFKDLDIPREFMHDFDDPEDFGEHDGIPWWAMPIKVEEPEKKVYVKKTVRKKVKGKVDKDGNASDNAENADKEAEEDPNAEGEESVTYRYVCKDRKDLCEYCGFIRAHITKHINQRHLMQDKPCNDCGQKVSLTKKHVCESFPRRRNKCLCTCGEGFVLVETLHAHVTVENGKGRQIHKFQCIQCKETVDNKTDFMAHLQTHIGKFQCDVCSKYFRNSSILKAHKKNHTAVNQFECEMCGQKFKKKLYCDNHMERVHRQVPVPCPHCEGMFKPGLSLNNHIRRQHLNRRDYVCEVCQRTFNQLGALKYHLTIHTGERPFPCPFCHQAFKCNKDLRRHYANHKDLTIKCPMCKNYFLNEEELKYHCNRYHAADSNVREDIMQFEIVEEEYEIA